MLAQGIAHATGLRLDSIEPPTNMVYFDTQAPAWKFKELLAEKHRVLCGTTASHRIRMVTHLDIDDEDIERAAEAVCAVGSRL